MLSRNRKIFAVYFLVLNLFASQIGEFFLPHPVYVDCVFKCDGTRAETRFRLSVKRTSPFKSAGASVHSTTGNRSVRISCSNAGYIIFRVSVKSTGYPLHSPVPPSLPLPCVTVCPHSSSALYTKRSTVEIQTPQYWKPIGCIITPPTASAIAQQYSLTIHVVLRFQSHKGK